MRESRVNKLSWKNALLAVSLLGAAFLSGCPRVPLSGSPVQTPVLNLVEVPTATPGHWQTVSFATSTFAVLPVKGGGVRLGFNAPKAAAPKLKTVSNLRAPNQSIPRAVSLLNTGAPSQKDSFYSCIINDRQQGLSLD